MFIHEVRRLLHFGTDTQQRSSAPHTQCSLLQLPPWLSRHLACQGMRFQTAKLPPAISPAAEQLQLIGDHQHPAHNPGTVVEAPVLLPSRSLQPLPRLLWSPCGSFPRSQVPLPSAGRRALLQHTLLLSNASKLPANFPRRAGYRASFTRSGCCCRGAPQSEAARGWTAAESSLRPHRRSNLSSQQQ